MMLGAKKYSAWNWAKGMPSSEYWASLNRHVQDAAEGKTDEDHLSAIAFNVMGIIHNQEMKKLGLLPPELDDWPVNWATLMQPGAKPADKVVESEAMARIRALNDEIRTRLQTKMYRENVDRVTKHDTRRRSPASRQRTV